MANNGIQNNTSGARRASLTAKPARVGALFTDEQRMEIVDFLIAEIPAQAASLENVTFSTTPPQDKTKLWVQIDGKSGQAISGLRRYNAESGSWENADADEVAVLSLSEENLIVLDAQNRWLVPKPRVEEVVYTVNGSSTTKNPFPNGAFLTAESFRIVGLIPYGDVGADGRVWIAAKEADGITLGYNLSSQITVRVVVEEAWESIIESYEE